MNDLSFGLSSTKRAYRERIIADFATFCQWIFKKKFGSSMAWHDHNETLAMHLEDVFHGRRTNILFAMPPRYGKTELTCKMFPVWCLLKQQANCHFMQITGSVTLYRSAGEAIKDYLQMEVISELWPELSVDGSLSYLSFSWNNQKKGGWRGIEAGGSVIGHGCGTATDFAQGKGFGGCMLLDDLMNPKDMRYAVIRNRINNYFSNTLQSRVNSGKTPIIGIMQRLGLDDTINALMNEQKYRKFKLVSMPAIIDEGTDSERALWPAKHDLPTLKRMRDAPSMLQRSDFSAQYMQQPVMMEQGLIPVDQFRFYKETPRFKYVIVTFDSAQKDGRYNDYNVFQLWGSCHEKRAHLIDQVRFKAEAPETQRRFLRFVHHIQNHWKNGPLRKILIEDASAGSTILQNLKVLSMSRFLLPITAKRSKVDRAYDYSISIDQGLVLLPESQPNTLFTNEFLQEHREFTLDNRHRHDDQIDAAMYAVDFITETLTVDILAEMEALYGASNHLSDGAKKREVMNGIARDIIHDQHGNVIEDITHYSLDQHNRPFIV